MERAPSGPEIKCWQIPTRCPVCGWFSPYHYVWPFGEKHDATDEEKMWPKCELVFMHEQDGKDEACRKVAYIGNIRGAMLHTQLQ